MNKKAKKARAKARNEARAESNIVRAAIRAEQERRAAQAAAWTEEDARRRADRERKEAEEAAEEAAYPYFFETLRASLSELLPGVRYIRGKITPDELMEFYKGLRNEPRESHVDFYAWFRSALLEWANRKLSGVLPDGIYEIYAMRDNCPARANFIEFVVRGETESARIPAYMLWDMRAYNTPHIKYTPRPLTVPAERFAFRHRNED